MLQGNRIGTNTEGTSAIGNGGAGIFVSAAPGNQIGTSQSNGGNLVSGNAGSGIVLSSTDNSIEGNRIGTTADGLSALGNGENGILIAGGAGNSIGSPDPASRNLISANGSAGVAFFGGNSDGNRLENNWIGISDDGSDLGNISHGVRITGGNDNFIGTSEAGNVISGNGLTGVYINGIFSGSNNILGNRIGVGPEGTTTSDSAVPNDRSGVQIVNRVTKTRIGSANAGNVISGNGLHGILIQSLGTIDTIVQGNYVGTTADSNDALPNASAGIYQSAGPAGTVIGGNRNTGQGNVLSGNASQGVTIQSPGIGTRIVGNWIGTNAASDIDLGNQSFGVQLINADDVAIGGSASGQGNVIAGNSVGVRLFRYSSGNTIRGNEIGLPDLGNTTSGVLIQSASNDNAIVDNTIAYNKRGVFIPGTDAAGRSQRNTITRNTIHSNTSIGIDIGSTNVTANDAGDGDTGANLQQNSPVLNSASIVGWSLRIEYTVDSLPTKSLYPLTIEFFQADSSSQGQVYLGKRMFTEAQHSAGSAIATLAGVTLPLGTAVVATATDAAGNTSEFSLSSAIML